MKTWFRRLPPASGCVGLGLVGLGMLLRPCGVGFLWGCIAPALLFLLPVLFRLCLAGEGKAISNDLVSFSTLAGNPMAWMFLSAQLKTELGAGWAVWPWAAAVLWHLGIIVFFSRFLLRTRPRRGTVRGSWLLVYVGIAAAAISAPAFAMQAVGRILLIPAALGALILLPLVYAAEKASPPMPDPHRALFCISAAPVSIWLAGWLRSSAAPVPWIAGVLAAVAFLLYLPALLCAVRHLRDPFAPTCAAMTFPFVISASALKQTILLLGLSGNAALHMLVIIETATAALLCLYTAGRYIVFYYWKHV